MKDVVLLFAGSLVGVLFSVLFWYIWAHFIVPEIEFSQKIQKITRGYDQDTPAHRIKFRNTGKRRAIDLNIKVRVAIYEIYAKKTWNWYTISTDADDIPLVGPAHNRLIAIRPDETSDFSRNVFPDKINQKFADGSLNIEDILNLGTKSYMSVYIFANDEFSGARKLFISRRYQLEDICTGKFKGLELKKNLTPITYEAIGRD